MNTTESPDKRKRGWGTWIAAALVLLALYVGGYFVLSQYHPDSFSMGFASPTRRYFDYGWMIAVYKPLGIIESVARGKTVPLSVGHFTNDDGKRCRVWVENIKRWVRF